MSIFTKYNRLAGLQGWRAWLACYLSGALMALAFAPFDLWPVIFLALPIFYAVLDGAAHWKAATLRGFFFGYGYFMAGTWWIANSMRVDVAKFGWMIPVSILGLSAVFAVCFAAFGFLKHRWRSPRLTQDLVRFSVLWVAMEYGRSLGIFGFPWNLAGTIALSSIHVAQAAAWIGSFGLSFFVVRIGLAPVLLRADQPRVLRRASLIVPVLVIAAAMGYGHARIPETPALTPTVLRLVQPSIPQTLKADPASRWQVMDVLGSLSRTPGTKISAIVWPETAMPFTLWPRDTVGKQLMESLRPGVPLVTGAVTAEGDPQQLRIWNSVVAFSPQGDVLARYTKHQLVPFGEFVPGRRLLPLEKITPGDIDFSRGPGPQTISVPGLPPFSALVCYEVIFPWISIDAKHRPEWILNVTNDGWYGDSPGPYQHFAMARMRAIEQGLPLVRAANNGISALIDPYGQVREWLPLNARAALDAQLPAPLVPTFYGKHGEFASLVLLITAWIATCLPLKHRRYIR